MTVRSSLLLGISALAFLLIIPFILWASYNNTEISLRNQTVAQQKANEAVFDQTWKIISQQAQIANEYKNSFEKIYPQLMEGRYGNARGGALLSFITESNPNFDTKLYSQLANSIEIQRTEFTREQKKLIDIKREHDVLRQSFPSNLFVGNRPEIQITIVTSHKTEETFRTGKDEDIEVFGKDKK